MSGRGEDRLLEQIFPISRVLLLADHRSADGLPAAATGKDHGIVRRKLARAAEWERRHAEPTQRLHQAEPGLPVMGEHVPGDGAAVGRAEPEALGLDDEIADGEHETAFADHHAAAAALRAEDRGGGRVLRYIRLKTH